MGLHGARVPCPTDAKRLIVMYISPMPAMTDAAPEITKARKNGPCKCELNSQSFVKKRIMSGTMIATKIGSMNDSACSRLLMFPTHRSSH